MTLTAESVRTNLARVHERIADAGGDPESITVLAITKGFTGDRRIFNIPLYLFPKTVRAAIRALTGRFTHPADEAFFRQMLVSHFLGTMQGLFTDRGKNKLG